MKRYMIIFENLKSDQLIVLYQLQLIYLPLKPYNCLRKKVLTPFKYLKFVTLLIHYSSMSKHHSISDYSRRKPQIMVKDMTLTPDGSYSTWNPGVNQKRSGIYKCNQQKSHVFQGSSFLALGFSRGGKHFNGITLIMTFDFSRISKTNLETSVEYLQRYFLNHPVRFFFWNRLLIDRQTFCFGC